MGEALIVRRGSGAKVAEGFPKSSGLGGFITVPDLIGCNGFAMFVVGSGRVGGYGQGSTTSVYYDGSTVIEITSSSSSTSTGIDLTDYKATFDPTIGKISLKIGFGSGYDVQCIYW